MEPFAEEDAPEKPGVQEEGKDKGNVNKEGSEKEPGVKSESDEGLPPKGPWGDRGVTHRNAGLYKVPEKSSTLNVRINLDLRADVALELHAVVQGSVIIGLF